MAARPERGGAFEQRNVRPQTGDFAALGVEFGALRRDGVVQGGEVAGVRVLEGCVGGAEGGELGCGIEDGGVGAGGLRWWGCGQRGGVGLLRLGLVMGLGLVGWWWDWDGAASVWGREEGDAGEVREWWWRGAGAGRNGSEERVWWAGNWP